MTAADRLGTYAEGWTKGDAHNILKAVSEGYTLDDPNADKISKRHFAVYLATTRKDSARSLRGGSLPTPFMQLSEVLTQENPGFDFAKARGEAKHLSGLSQTVRSNAYQTRDNKWKSAKYEVIRAESIYAPPRVAEDGHRRALPTGSRH